MILEQKQTTIAYRCPDCGQIVRSVVGVFSLSADMIKLKCPCGGSEMDIVYTKDKKVRLAVPCFICPAPHSYLISNAVFFEHDIFTLACTYSGMDICFIGKEDKVNEAIEQNDAELENLIGDARNFESISDMRRDDKRLTDPQVLEIVMYVIKELEEEGAVHCRCTDGGEYELQFGDESMFVVCKKCGAEAEIRTDSIDAAYAFLNADELVLE